MGVPFKYPLETVFGIREKAKKQAEDTYTLARKKENEEKSKLSQLEEELVRMQQERIRKRDEYLNQTSGKVVTVDHIQIMNRHIDKLKEDEKNQEKKIEAQKQTLELAVKHTEECLEALNKATQELKVLEKHKEKWLAIKRKEIAAKEEEAADEIAQSQYFAKMQQES